MAETAGFVKVDDYISGGTCDECGGAWLMRLPILARSEAPNEALEFAVALKAGAFEDAEVEGCDHFLEQFRRMLGDD